MIFLMKKKLLMCLLNRIGSNLYDKQHLLNTGWLPDGTANVYRMDNVGYVDMFPPTVFKSNTQYKYTFGAHLLLIGDP